MDHTGLGLFMVAEGPSRGPFWQHGDEWTWVEPIPGFTSCQWFLLHCQGMRVWTERKIEGPIDLDSNPRDPSGPGDLRQVTSPLGSGPLTHKTEADGT